MPYTHKPTFPVVDPDPSMGRCMSNFSFNDFSNIAIATATGYGFGWFGGIFFLFISVYNKMKYSTIVLIFFLLKKKTKLSK